MESNDLGGIKARVVRDGYASTGIAMDQTCPATHQPPQVLLALQRSGERSLDLHTHGHRCSGFAHTHPTKQQLLLKFPKTFFKKPNSLLLEIEHTPMKTSRFH